MTERDARARRVAIEVSALLQDLEDLGRRAPVALEQVRLEEPQLGELTDAGQLQVERE